ncbi:flagellar biosynthetic protein FliO [Massilia sp. GCM10020059]|uniref:Flagellar protein n=1 Tax=Massilia agrisoli TaxID=2892444 RepID=A0ABS8ITW0_9BURK|nr:flagellar biosynthetic protein FliO [Massilia agrisoli]MCC6071321.1 flagellar biosynthetic protein FliO [Massilia agrisoli]
MTARLLPAAALLCCFAAPVLAAAATAPAASPAVTAATTPVAPAVNPAVAPAVTPPAANAPAVTTPADATAPAADAAPTAPAPAETQFVTPRPAQPTAPAAAAVAQPTGSAAGSLMQTTFALLLVLGLLAALAWFLKRYGPKAAGGSANLRMVGALNLGGRERIMVVEVGDQWIVVGASPGRVNALATMPKQHSVDTPPSMQPGLPMAGGFSDWLKQTIDKRNAK